MSTSDQFLLALQAYQEIQAELRHEDHPQLVLPEVSTANTPAVQAAGLPAGSSF